MPASHEWFFFPQSTWSSCTTSRSQPNLGTDDSSTAEPAVFIDTAANESGTDDCEHSDDGECDDGGPGRVVDAAHWLRRESHLFTYGRCIGCTCTYIWTTYGHAECDGPAAGRGAQVRYSESTVLVALLN